MSSIKEQIEAVKLEDANTLRAEDGTKIKPVGKKNSEHQGINNIATVKKTNNNSQFLNGVGEWETVEGYDNITLTVNGWTQVAKRLYTYDLGKKYKDKFALVLFDKSLLTDSQFNAASFADIQGYGDTKLCATSIPEVDIPVIIEWRIRR